MTRPPRDLGASVRARLLQLARSRGEDFQLLLTRYANERLLYRLAQSPYRSRFILKGAALFMVWTSELHRTTRDIDLLGFGDADVASLRQVFTEFLRLDTGNDGVVFDAESVEVTPIRKAQEYGGVRVVVRAAIASARVRLQVDVGFGDAITPEAIDVEYPTLLDFPPPRLLAYPPETVVAEKLEAIVRLGLVNTRIKDFYDLVILSRMFEFDGGVLVEALRNTFGRRRTQIVAGMPAQVLEPFVSDPAKAAQWTAFVQRTGAQGVESLHHAASEISKFATRPLAAAATGTSWKAHWPRGGPWTEFSKP